VHQAGVVPALGQDRFDPVLLAKDLAADEVDRQVVVLGEPLRVRSQFLPVRLGPAG
jgi:hypothetical protein